MEVMISMLILGIIAVGVTQNLVLTRGIAETNIRESTANAAASGYLEQVKSMEFERILTSVKDPDIPIPTVLNQGDADPIPLGEWTTKTIVIDEDLDTGHERLMPFYILMEIEDLEDSGNGDVLGIEVYYGWEDPRTGRRHERSLRTMRSYVPTF